MRIGIFDSGLGGLFLARAIIRRLPQYDYLYLGDTKRLPYGNRSQETVYEFTRECVDFLFKHDCKLVIVACNTASARALRRIKQEYLPKHYPNRRVLGVIIPTLEAIFGDRTSTGRAMSTDRIGILATESTVDSHAYAQELKKISTNVEIKEVAAPLLVPMIEEGALDRIEPIVQSYLDQLMSSHPSTIVLGCTHYAILKDMVQRLIGPAVLVISQDEVVPDRLVDYLERHPEIKQQISKNSERTFYVTDLTPHFQKTAREWLGNAITLDLVMI